MSHFSVSRTKVIDDEMDYFSVDSNRWITHEDKKKLRAKEEELRRLKYDSRGNKAITLDFAGRKVIEDPTVVGEFSLSLCLSLSLTHTHTK